MGSRTWIKIHCEDWLKKSLRQETPEVRGIWADVLALAGDMDYGDDGKISLPNNVPLHDDQIASIFNVKTRVWIKGKTRLLETERIGIDEDGCIQVINWKKYQSEYRRQKPYRQKLQPQVIGLSDTEKEKEKEKEKENKEKSKETAPASPGSVDKSVQNSKPSSQEIQDTWIERIAYAWKNTFKQEIKPSQINLLVWGSRKGGRVYGFKVYEALAMWVGEMKNHKFTGSAFNYALKVAETEAGTHPYRKRAHDKYKVDKMQIGSVMDGMRE